MYEYVESEWCEPQPALYRYIFLLYRVPHAHFLLEVLGLNKSVRELKHY